MVMAVASAYNIYDNLDLEDKSSYGWQGLGRVSIHISIIASSFEACAPEPFGIQRFRTWTWDYGGLAPFC